MTARSKLFSMTDPYGTTESNILFLNAVKENCEFQYGHCPVYKTILDHMEFTPDKLRSYDDISELPFIPTLFFKRHEFYSMPERKMRLKATSSGTSGKMSHLGFETGSLLCAMKMLWTLGRIHRLFSAVPANYVILGYKPHKGNHTMITKTAFGASFLTPALHRTYALNDNGGGYTVDFDHVMNALLAYGRSLFPVRLIGFPSYAYFLLRRMDEQVLYDLVEKVLGIKENNITEVFSAAEHPILYCSCPKHHFHIPAYGRVIIRDAATMKPVGYGETGLVNLITPLVMAMPLLSVVTDDLGVLHDGMECGCGITAPYLEIIGRVGLDGIKTCAAGATEMLKGDPV